MSRSQILTVITVAASLLLGALFAGAGANQMLQAQPSAVAVVDVAKVRSQLEESKHISAELQQQVESFQQEDRDRLGRIKELEEDLRALVAPESEAFQKKREEIQFKIVEARTWRTVKQAQINSEHALQMERLYRKIIGAISDVASVEGYDIVLFKEQPVDFTQSKLNEIDTRIAMRKVLWSRDEMDITDRVVQKMNNDFDAGL